jgi:hypothetical protein
VTVSLSDAAVCSVGQGADLLRYALFTGNYRIQFPAMKEAVAYFGDYSASLVATTIAPTATATPLPTSTVSLNPAASASVSSALVAGGQDS